MSITESFVLWMCSSSLAVRSAEFVFKRLEEVVAQVLQHLLLHFELSSELRKPLRGIHEGGCLSAERRRVFVEHGLGSQHDLSAVVAAVGDHQRHLVFELQKLCVDSRRGDAQVASHLAHLFPQGGELCVMPVHVAS